MEHLHKEDTVAKGAVSTDRRELDAMLALPLAVSLQGLWGHSTVVAAVCRDFHTSINKWADKVMYIHM